MCNKLLNVTIKILNNYIIHNLGNAICSYLTHIIHFSYVEKPYNILISTNNNIINNTTNITKHTFIKQHTQLYIKYGTYIEISFNDIVTDIQYIHTDYIIGLMNDKHHFMYQFKLHKLPKNIDTQKVNNMSKMFAHALSFNSNLNRWDTSHVSNMSGMFNGARSFNSGIDKFNTSNVTDMSCMFDCAYNFNQNISSWDTKNVQFMHYMFWGAYRFNCMFPDGDLTKWNISNVVCNKSMFAKTHDKLVIPFS